MAITRVSTWAVIFSLVYFLGICSTQEEVQVSELCMNCICEAVSNCTLNTGCKRDICGPFKITWPYWADAGKPVIAGDNPDSPEAFGRCASDTFCAAATVRGYMAKFAQDCNNDAVVNCRDFAALHLLGGYGCQAALKPSYAAAFDKCVRDVNALGGHV